jgi:hypothetical protein
VKKLITAVIALVALAGADGALTVWAVSRGLAEEGNPLLASIADQPLLVAFKVAVAVLFASILSAAARRPRERRVAVAGFTVSLAVQGGVVALWVALLTL